MASPVDSARQGTNITTAATSHNINVGSPVAGTLLIVMVRFAAAPGTVTFTGYTQFAVDTSDASDDDTRLYYRWADGTEGADDTLSTTNSVKLAAISWEVTGAENPATFAPMVSAVAIGTAANINPNAAAIALDATSITSASVITGDGGTFERHAQSFTALGTTVSNVSAKLLKNGTPTDDVTLELVADSGDSPTGSLVGTIGTINSATLTGSGVVYDFACSIAVTVGTKYWVTIRRASTDAANRPGPFISSSDFVSWGSYRRRDSGSWSAPGAWDMAIKVDFTGSVYTDALFLAVVGLDSETATFTQPTGYSNLAQANSGTGGAVATNCMIAGASKAVTGALSDDPGAWTSTAPATGVTAWTIAIPAAAAAAPGPGTLRPQRSRRLSRYLTFR